MSEPDDDNATGEIDEGADEFARLSELLYERVEEFADEEDVDDEVIPALLLQLAVTMRTMNYTGSVAKPSGSGLKLDLDRFVRLAEDLVRETKKEADVIVAGAKAAIEAAEQEAGDET